MSMPHGFEGLVAIEVGPNPNQFAVPEVGYVATKHRGLPSSDPTVAGESISF